MHSGPVCPRRLREWMRSRGRFGFGLIYWTRRLWQPEIRGGRAARTQCSKVFLAAGHGSLSVSCVACSYFALTRISRGPHGTLVAECAGAKWREMVYVKLLPKACVSLVLSVSNTETHNSYQACRVDCQSPVVLTVDLSLWAGCLRLCGLTQRWLAREREV